MTTDNHTPDPAPALLPPAHLAEIRERADAPLRPMPDAEERAAYFGQAIADRAALLAHLDALTAPAPADGGEALGRMVGRARYDAQGIGDAAERVTSWDQLDAEERAVYVAIGTTLHAIGHAAGRSEGEAERARDDAFTTASLNAVHRRDAEIARLTAARASERASAAEAIDGQAAEIARLTAELAAAHDRALAHGVAVVASTERAMQAQIDALAAELAEARASVVHADFAGGLSVCSRPGETTKDVARITCPACLVRLYSVANEDADKMRQEVERLLAERDTDLLDATEKERTACAAFLRSEGLEGAAAEMVGVRARAARRARGEGQGS